jgi:hypothetical protein
MSSLDDLRRRINELDAFEALMRRGREYLEDRRSDTERPA